MPPANDAFASRIILTGSSGTWSGSNVGATTETGEPSPGVWPYGASIWFQWTCPATGRYEWNTYGSSADTILDILQGASLAALTTVAANDDSRYVSTAASSVHVNLTSGQVYYVRVSGYSGATGSIILNWAPFTAPSRPPDPVSATIQLLDGFAMNSGGYVGRWVINIPALTAPGDGNVGEYNFMITKPDLTEIGFSIDTDYFLANEFAAGLILDTADMEWWVDEAGSFISSSLPVNANVYDGGFAGPFDLGYPITIDEANSSPDWWRSVPGPEITAVTPDTGSSGDVVVIAGVRLVDILSVAFAGASVDAYNPQYAAFTPEGPTEVDAEVPATAVTGPIMVTTGDGSAVFPFTVPGTFGIASLSTLSAPEGAEVTITGSGFSTATAVYWVPDGISGASQSFTVDSDTQIRFTFTRGGLTETSGRISVLIPSGMTIRYSYDHLELLTAPSGLDITPATGSPGDTITLTGTHLGFVDDVYVEAYPGGVTDLHASFTIVDDSTITFTVGVWASGEYVVFAHNAAGGDSAATHLTVASDPPVIDSFTPGSSMFGGTVIVSGAGFFSITEVTVNGVAASFVVDSDTQITLTVPVGSTTGPITATNVLGTATSATDLVVHPPPTISSVAPAFGIAGDLITLIGAFFTDATTVTVGAQLAAFTVVDDGTITFTVPAHWTAVTAVAIVVTTPYGTTSVSGFVVATRSAQVSRVRSRKNRS